MIVCELMILKQKWKNTFKGPVKPSTWVVERIFFLKSSKWIRSIFVLLSQIFE